VVTTNTPIANPTNATAMANSDLVHPKDLREMKHLGGWFNLTALEYIAQSKQDDKLRPIVEDMNKTETNTNATALREGREVAGAMLLHAVSEFAFDGKKG